MTLLSNLLLYQPGYSGFSSYVRRVMPAIPGWRLLLDSSNGPTCQLGDVLPVEPPSTRVRRLMLRLSLPQHAISVKRILADSGIYLSDLSGIYSPYCDFLFECADLPQVITCHDLTPLYFSNSRKAVWRYRFWTPRHLKHADTVIAISRFVADQLIETGISARKIEVIPNGIEVSPEPITRPASFDYIMLARHDLNKNVCYAVRAFALLLEKNPSWPGVLKIVGRKGRETAALKRLLSLPILHGKISLIDAMPQADMVRTIRSSLGLISTSSMEGFNYPVLEAMAEGVPTLISSIPVHQELYSGCSRFFNLDPGLQQLSAAMLELGSDQDLWTQISTAGMQRAQSLSVIRQQRAINQLIQARL